MEKFNQPVRLLSFILTLVAIVSFITGCATWMSTDGEKATYMVIDLSRGTNAPSYPVRYLRSVPKGGWTDEYKTTKLVMRKIQAGTFSMGGRTTDHPGLTELGLHTVTLTKDFYIGIFEVTQRQWELVMGNRPSCFTNNSYYATRPVEYVSYYDIRENPTNSAICPNWPFSSQTHANSFIGKMRSKTGLSSFDLPTESQWEYACRAGTITALNTGHNLLSEESDPRLADVARYNYNGYSEFGYDESSDTSQGTAKVGSYLPNAWGLYDLHGNVYEWCLDWYGTYPGTTTDPLGAMAWSGRRVLRGGCWGDKAHGCCSASRFIFNPNSRASVFGFRAAMTLP